MNKSIIFKSALISAMLVAMVVALVPAVNAVYVSDTKTANGRSGTWVGYGLGGDYNSGVLTGVSFHAGAGAGSATFVSLYHSFVGTSGLSDSGTTSYQPYDLPSRPGPFSSATAYATATFKDGAGTFTVSSGLTARIP